MAIQSDSQIANDIDKYNLKDTCITQQTILDHAALLSRSMKCVSLNKTITDTGRENYSGLKRLSSQWILQGFESNREHITAAPSDTSIIF